MHFKLIIIFSILFLNFQYTQASEFLFEPYVGYRYENVKMTNLPTVLNLNPETNHYNSSLPVYGLKLGYSSPIGIDLNLAGDISKGKINVTIDSLESEAEYTHQMATVQMGVSALGILKLYIGYSFLNEYKIEDYKNTNFTLIKGFSLKGPAYLVGIQFKLLPYILIGAQYNFIEYKTISGIDGTSEENTNKYFSKIDSQDYSLYLSLDF